MSGKFRKVFDSKHIVLTNPRWVHELLEKQSGRIGFLNLPDVDALPRQYDEVKILQIVYPSSMWPEEKRAWYIHDVMEFSNLQLSSPSLEEEILWFEFTCDDCKVKMNEDFTKHPYGL